MNKIIFILVGNIGSGKSTLTKYLADHGYIAISRDSLRYATGGGNYLLKPKFEPIIHQANMFLFYKFSDLGMNITIDAGNVTKESRKDYIRYGHRKGYQIIAVEMPRFTKEESIVRRLKKNHGDTTEEIWEKVWDKFNNLYQSPDNKEGFNKIIRLTKDKFADLEVVDKFILECSELVLQC